MNYQETVEWMFEQLPFYQNQGGKAFKPGLEKITAFLAYLGNPQERLRIIHVGGTNGKGSTAHLMASVLQEKNLRIGIYSSPHLIDFRERIKINGKWIEESTVIKFIESNKDFISKHQMSFFEISFAMSLVYFEKQNLDFVFVEVGMGGRLDATNVVTPILSVITNIGIDHTQYLGTTHTAIALEKAGIIKAGVPVVIGESRPDTHSVFTLKAQTENAPIYFADSSAAPVDWTTIGMDGLYQIKNAQTAYCALQQINEIQIDIEQVINGFKAVCQNTKLLGRWQQIQKQPKVIVDVSHNKEGFVYVSQALKKESYYNLYLVLGFVKDKDIIPLLQTLPSGVNYFLCAPDLFRALPLVELEKVATTLQLKFRTFPSVWQAFQQAQNQAKVGDLIVVTGSTFVVGEVLEKINQQ